MEKLDSIDRGILDQLQRDGRISNSKLAVLFSLSETSCWRRLKRLEDAGLIDGYYTALNRRKLGLGVMAYVQIVCTQHSEEVTAEFERIIQASPNILACDNTTGEADYLLHVVAADLDDYSRFVEKVLRKLPGVFGIRSSISLRQVKSTRRLPII
ncbi:Lrp/AsnC family transcriptional regulator [Paraburkholderia lycopersici]|uniref:DNA-binding transcriptional regulator, Lrp family n=1 Tax=Paraburkholderia lycopersici TaxID=416944 RepID=A0A1G6MNX9_9BURK|nr:Lrp/AsnC family transcriptional regulator [Paraburkholderia lycopersici]SDC57239.1 DNA-binding transcriptional regulator, Lrp family [Paraburkholderia lycopersici]